MTQRNVITGVLILAGIVILAFFGIRAIRAFRHLKGHGPLHGKPPAANQTDVAVIRDWMTVPYIAHLYDVPPDAIFKSLQIPKGDDNAKKSLAQLNSEYYPGQAGVVLAHVQAVIQAFQQQHPPPRFPGHPGFHSHSRAMSASISNFLLTEVINYGAPLFALTLFLGALGLPLPGSIMVIAVGAFSQEGYFSWLPMCIVGFSAAVMGDMLSFGMGYYGKDWIEGKFGSSPTWNAARQSFQGRAWLAILLTRFLITALAIPTNLIAGGSGYRFSRFLLYDLFGEFIWIFVYGGLGYLFGSQWELVKDFVSNFGGAALGLAILGAGLWLARNWRAEINPAGTA